MSLKFECTHCQDTLKVAETLRGKLVRCPSCQEITRVPAARGGASKNGRETLAAESGALARDVRVRKQTVLAPRQREFPDEESESSRDHDQVGRPRDRYDDRATKGRLKGVLVCACVGVLFLAAGVAAGMFVIPRFQQDTKIVASTPAPTIAFDADKKALEQKNTELQTKLDEANKQIAETLKKLTDAAETADQAGKHAAEARKKADDDLAQLALIHKKQLGEAKKKTEDLVAQLVLVNQNKLAEEAKKKAKDDAAVQLALANKNKLAEEAKKKADDDVKLAREQEQKKAAELAKLGEDKRPKENPVQVEPKKTADPQPPTQQSELDKLQGFWKVEKTEKNSKENFRLFNNEGAYIEDQKLFWTRKNGLLDRNSEGKLLLDTSKSPLELEIANDKGATIPMIYKIEGDKLTLAVRLEGRSEMQRPTDFSIKLGPGRATHLLILKRVPDQISPQIAKKPVPPAERAELDKAFLNDLQGLWIMDKTSENGSGDFRSRFNDAIYIESKKVCWVQKNGRFGSPYYRAELTMDASKSPLELTFGRVNNPGLGDDGDIKTICKIEGNKMIIAVRTDGGPRPLQFSTNLAAGRQRATNIFQFSRVKALAAKEEPPPPQGKREDLEKAAFKDLQGFWRLEKASSNSGGRDFHGRFADGIYIERDTVVWAEKNGRFGFPTWHSHLTIDPTKSPAELDFVKLLLPNNGGGGDIHAIYKLNGDDLVIAVRADDGPRPRLFTDELTAGIKRATHVFYFARVLPEKVADKTVPKPPEGNPDDLQKAALKELQGLWILDRSDKNTSGADLRARFEGGVYIENQKAIWVNKDGSIPKQHWKANLKLDATKNPLELDFSKLENHFHGKDHDIKAIYKIEGNKLTIALRVDSEVSRQPPNLLQVLAESARPRQFTIDLTAGSERATHIFYFLKKNTE